MFSSRSARRNENGAALIEGALVMVLLLALLMGTFEITRMSRSRAQLATLSRELSKGAFQLCHLVDTDADRQLCVERYLFDFLSSAKDVRRNFTAAVSIYKTGPALSAKCSGEVINGVVTLPVLCPGTYDSRFAPNSADPTKKYVGQAGTPISDLLTAQSVIYIGEIRDNYVASGRRVDGIFQSTSKDQEENSVM